MYPVRHRWGKFHEVGGTALRQKELSPGDDGACHVRNLMAVLPIN